MYTVFKLHNHTYNINRFPKTLSINWTRTLLTTTDFPRAFINITNRETRFFFYLFVKGKTWRLVESLNKRRDKEK